MFLVEIEFPLVPQTSLSLSTLAGPGKHCVLTPYLLCSPSSLPTSSPCVLSPKQYPAP